MAAAMNRMSMQEQTMPEPFDPIEYLSFVRARWKFVAGTVGAAVLLTAIACWALPNRFTATATLVIEPPSGSDPRTATAISPIYLESLKTYEQFAASDSLFAKAIQKFHLLPESAPSTVESLKSRVLRVEKPKDTKVLQISATLADPKLAQALVQFLAEETVSLSRSIANSAEGGARTELTAKLEQARAELERARKNQATVEATGSASALEEEIRSLGDRKARASAEVLAANATLAELAEKEKALRSSGSADALAGVRQEIASLQARMEVFKSGAAALEREASSKSATLASLSARVAQAGDEVRAAQIAFEALAQRATDLVAASGSRSEQLRIVDPGIVPQRPSFPKPSLYMAAALVISAALTLVFLTLQFGLSRRRTESLRSELKVARGGGR
jgi:uncharacterized protein involved in exopolysaccharide biosynthesis